MGAAIVRLFGRSSSSSPKTGKSGNKSRTATRGLTGAEAWEKDRHSLFVQRDSNDAYDPEADRKGDPGQLSTALRQELTDRLMDIEVRQRSVEAMINLTTREYHAVAQRIAEAKRKGVEANARDLNLFRSQRTLLASIYRNAIVLDNAKLTTTVVLSLGDQLRSIGELSEALRRVREELDLDEVEKLLDNYQDYTRDVAEMNRELTRAATRGMTALELDTTGNAIDQPLSDEDQVALDEIMALTEDTETLDTRVPVVSRPRQPHSDAQQTTATLKRNRNTPLADSAF